MSHAHPESSRQPEYRPDAVDSGMLEEVLNETAAQTPGAALEALSRAEIDIQIATAKKYPRSHARFLKQLETLCTSSQAIAKKCYYTLPKRDDNGRPIEGPSIRMAEMAAQSWQNIRVEAIILDDSAEFVTVRASCHDLESNNAVAMQVRRRIVNKYGKRYSLDMIQNTTNAARSIAIRNAICSIIPRAYLDDMVDKCKRVFAGDEKTLGKRRQDTIDALHSKKKIHPSRVYAALGVTGIEDIGLMQFAELQGMLNSIEEGRCTADDCFPDPHAAKKEAPRNADDLAQQFSQAVGKTHTTDAFVDLVVKCAYPKCAKSISGEPYVALGQTYCARACADLDMPA